MSMLAAGAAVLTASAWACFALALGIEQATTPCPWVLKDDGLTIGRALLLLHPLYWLPQLLAVKLTDGRRRFR